MHNVEQLGRRIRRLTGRAIGDFGLIENHDRILVALSGGKDSWTLLHVLDSLRKRAPVTFSLMAVTVHPGFPGFHTEQIRAYLEARGFAHRIVHAPIHEIMLSKLRPGDAPCSLCSRLRRGVLYGTAEDLGCTKIALGHHRDDFIETLLLNLFFNGKIKAMAPLLDADDGKNVVIRPLVYVAEDDILAYASASGFPVTCCACPSCGDPDLNRVKVKKLLAGLERERPGVKASLVAALADVDHRHLLMKENRKRTGSPRRGPRERTRE